MQNIRDEINTYIKTIQIPSEQITSLASDIFGLLSKLNTTDINDNVNIVADLFCKTLAQLKVEDLSGNDLEKSIAKAFNNIKNMNVNKDDIGKLEYSNVHVVSFLRKLNNMQDSRVELDVIEESFQSQFEVLSENLDNIKVVFRIKKQNKIMFPIGKLLACVITSTRFNFDVLDMTTLNTLLLALEIFNTSEYHKENDKLRKLIDECDIKCLSYLEKDSVKRLGEKSWRLNFQENGLLLLVDIVNKKVLIRHEDFEYFSKLSKEELLEVKDEKNSNGKRIASYYEYRYCDNDEFISLEDIVLSEKTSWKKKLLEIVYNNENYNCFYKDAFLLNGDEIKLVNPLTSKDFKIVRDGRDELTLMANVTSVTNECMNKYWLELIMDKALNCVNIGLACKLLMIENISVDLLFKDLDDNKSYQNQLIRNWILSTQNPYDSLLKIQDKYFKSLRYLQSYQEMNTAIFSELYLYPLMFDDSIIDKILNIEYLDVYNIIPTFIKVPYSLDFYGQRNFISDDGENIKAEDIIYIDDIFENKDFIYSIRNKDGKWLIGKLIHNLGQIKLKIEFENKSLMLFDTLNQVAESQIGYVKSYMLLHKDALLDQHHVNIGFVSMMKFRLVNNINFYKIDTKDKWDAFLDILGSHDAVTFEDIVDLVESNSEGILYVPKERQESDSVLTSIINKYLRKDSSRNTDYYCTDIDLSDSMYYLRGNKIKEIVILFDTLQSGTSTKRTLDFYFKNYKLNSIGNQPNRTMKYYLDGNQVDLMSIIEANKATLKISFIYGTKEGLVEIEKHLKDNKIKATIDCKNRINSSIDEQLINKCIKIYPYPTCPMSKGQYPIIREFNQPKLNLFPHNMLDSEKVYSLFVKKKEIMK